MDDSENYDWKMKNPKNEKKTVEELKELAPSIFTAKPSDEVSKHYSHIPTDRLIKDMEILGWGVVDAKEVKARTNKTKGYQKLYFIFNPDPFCL